MAEQVEICDVWCADSDVQFLHGLLEGMANIEARSYSLLTELGAATLTKVSQPLPAASCTAQYMVLMLYCISACTTPQAEGPHVMTCCGMHQS